MAGSDNRRQFGRLVCAGLVSDLGEVSDLSAGGCRLVCWGLTGLKVGRVLLLTLTGESVSAVVKVKVVRHSRTGMFRHEYGLEFVDLTPDQRRAIVELSQITAVKRLMPTVEEAAERAA